MRVTMHLALLVVLAAAYWMLWTRYLPLLPDQIAAHFGASQAVGWADKDAFFSLYTAVTGFTVGAVFLVGLLVGVAPSLLNIPNRDYWLAPARRQETVAHMRALLFEVGNATLLFLTVVAWTVIEANLRATYRLPPAFFWALTGFLAYVFARAIGLVLRYRRR